MSKTLSADYWVYILLCENNSYYTGYTTNLAKRYQSHVDGSGRCKYTRSFKPIAIVQCWEIKESKILAMQLEKKIKQLSKSEKIKLIAQPTILSSDSRVQYISNQELLSLWPIKGRNKMTNAQFIHSIDPQKNVHQLKQEIFDKNNDFYIFTFKQAINDETDTKKISIDDFWKLAKIKAKKVSLFVDEILTCAVIESAPLGFIREITMPGNDVTQGNEATIVSIKERVIIDDSIKTLLFFQLQATGKILLFAINEVTEENDNVYFSGYYAYNIPKNSILKEDQDFIIESNKILPHRVENMIAKMKLLFKNNQWNKIYQQLYG